jgi:hypothetical protein
MVDFIKSGRAPDLPPQDKYTFIGLGQALYRTRCIEFCTKAIDIIHTALFSALQSPHNPRTPAAGGVIHHSHLVTFARDK